MKTPVRTPKQALEGLNKAWDSGSLDGEAFIEFDCGMTELLLRIFSEEQPYPFNEGFLGRVTRPRFVHRREEARLRALGINPWPDA